MINAMQIGYGYWGANVANKLYQLPEISFRVLAETDPKKRERASSRFRDVNIVENYKEYLTNEIDVVFITTQTEYSYSIAMDVMNKGKHVFIEKPLAKNSEKAIDLINLSGSKNVVLHCDHLMVYNPVVRRIKQMISNGEIGEIQYIDIVRANLGPIRRDINALLDLAVHDIAVSDYLLGSLKPEEVQYCGTKTIGDKDTISYLTMKQDGILISINSSWVSPVKIRRMLVAGSKTMCIFDDTKVDKLIIYNKGIDIKQGLEYGEYEYKTRLGDVIIPHIQDEDSLMNSIQHFCDCVLNGKRSLSGPEQSLRVMRILDAAIKISENQSFL